MSESISIRKLLKAIKTLPSDEPVFSSRAWYTTQKEHWIGWTSQYQTSNVYGRQYGHTRDAKFVYNHVVNERMLLWITDAADIDRELVKQAQDAVRALEAEGATRQAMSAAVRRIVPWEMLAKALWPKG